MTWLRHEIGAYLLFSDGVDAMRGFGRQNGQGHALGLGLRLACVSALALGLANCASKPGRKGAGSSEIGAFSDPKYGKASPRVVGIDQDAPKGGGRYQVGNPYLVAGKRYVPREKPVGYTISGNASWYGVAFHGRKTANGEVYDRNSISAAHPTMPLPSYARVTNLTNNHSIVVRVNDRGPYHGGRVLDVSERAAGLLEFKHMGTARVKVDYLGPAALAGSDDARLVASLRRNGPAASPLPASPVQVASAEPAARAAQPLGFVQARPDYTARAEAGQGIAVPVRLTPVSNVPVPPARPFDLETIGGAARPVATPVSDTGPRSLPKARQTSLAFAGPEGLLSRFGAQYPFSNGGEALEAQPDLSLLIRINR